MNHIKRSYKVLGDYNSAYEFLKSEYTLLHLNSMMLPQFFEYAHTHPAFNHKLTHRMSLWEENEKIVGLCGYEMNIGEAYLICDNNHIALLPEMLHEAEQKLSIKTEKGYQLVVSVMNSQKKHINLLKDNGYSFSYSEPVRIYRFENGFPELSLPDGFVCHSLEGELDFEKLNRCIWRGFNHTGPVEYDIDAQKHYLGFHRQFHPIPYVRSY